MKLCIDCVYYTGNNRCTVQPCLVTGNPQDGWRGNADQQREDGFVNMYIMHTCGEVGRWFKAKNNGDR